MKKIGAPEVRSASEPQKHVLYVEDEAANWEVTELRLRNRYTLHWAKSDREACEILRALGDSIYAVLMDVQLSGSRLDGVNLTRLFRGKLPADQVPEYAKDLPTLGCPIFFVTAFGNLYSAETIEESGADATVAKPVDFVKLNLLLAKAGVKRTMAILNRT